MAPGGYSSSRERVLVPSQSREKIEFMAWNVRSQVPRANYNVTDLFHHCFSGLPSEPIAMPIKIALSHDYPKHIGGNFVEEDENMPSPLEKNNTLPPLRNLSHIFAAVLLVLVGSSARADSSAVPTLVDITRPGDTIVAISDGCSSSPPGEGVENAIDNDPNTKYLNTDYTGEPGFEILGYFNHRFDISVFAM